MTDWFTMPVPKLLSSTMRRTLRNKELINHGRHPLGGWLLMPMSEHKRCGTCKFLYAKNMGNKYFKCKKKNSSSPATDVRLKWPACSEWGDE